MFSGSFYDILPIVKRVVSALILLILLPYLSPLPDTDVCPVHGRGCVHGTECPAAKRKPEGEKPAICHTAGSHGQHEKTATFRCSISSCHADALGLADLDMPFVVALASSMAAMVSAPAVRHEIQKDEDLSPPDILEPPESLIYS
jgi:hypothetical protein